MKTSTLRVALLSASLVAAPFAVLGCAHHTEAERTEMRAHEMDDAADMIRRGEHKVADGKAKIAKGQALKDQGDKEKGDAEIAEGEAQKKSGEDMIHEGRKLREKAE